MRPNSNNITKAIIIRGTNKTTQIYFGGLNISFILTYMHGHTEYFASLFNISILNNILIVATKHILHWQKRTKKSPLQKNNEKRQFKSTNNILCAYVMQCDITDTKNDLCIA